MGKKVVVSAPGKLILLGEHAVVYNHPCIVTAVDQRMRATVEIIDKPEFQLEAEDVGITGYKKPLSDLGKGDIPKGAKFVEIAVKNILRHSGNPSADGASRISLVERDSGQDGYQTVTRQARMTRGIHVTTKSDFSSQFGFGSSSASTVCAIKGVSEILGVNLIDKEIFDLSYKTVLDIQKKGSGFDVAAAVFGGTLYFATGGKVIEFIDVKELPLIVGYSGIKANTVSLINKVKKSFANKQNRLNEIYRRIGVLVNKAKDSIIKMDWEKLGEIMNKNQEYLNELGVSIERLDNMIKAAIRAGAYGAKLSGAGGGDCMIAIVSNENKEEVKKGIVRAGGEIIDINTDVEGVKIE